MPAGGAINQVLAKNTASDFDTHWVNPGTPIWSDGYPTYDARYVRDTGDTMTGTLTMQNQNVNFRGDLFGFQFYDNTGTTLRGRLNSMADRVVWNAQQPLLFEVGVAERMRLNVDGTKTLTGGTVDISAPVGTLRLGRTDGNNAPNLSFMSSDFLTRYAYVQSAPAYMRLSTDVGCTGPMQLMINGVIQAQIDSSVFSIPSNILQVDMPAAWWSPASSYLDVAGVGCIGSAGSYRVSLMSNGYRTASGWADLAAGGLHGSAVLDLDPTGAILFRAQNTTPSSASGPPETARANQNAFLVGKTAYNTYQTTAGVEAWTANGQLMITNDAATFNAVVHVGAGDANGVSYWRFYRTGTTLIGSIAQNGTAGVLFNQTSDKRQKNFVRNVDDDEALDIIRAITPVHFTWIGNPDTSEKIGFFAQDLYLVAPEAVTAGEGEPGDEDFVPWGVDYGRLTPRIIAALQAMDRRLTDLEH